MDGHRLVGVGVRVRVRVQVRARVRARALGLWMAPRCSSQLLVLYLEVEGSHARGASRSDADTAIWRTAHLVRVRVSPSELTGVPACTHSARR